MLTSLMVADSNSSHLASAIGIEIEKMNMSVVGLLVEGEVEIEEGEEARRRQQDEMNQLIVKSLAQMRRQEMEERLRAMLRSQVISTQDFNTKMGIVLAETDGKIFRFIQEQRERGEVFKLFELEAHLGILTELPNKQLILKESKAVVLRNEFASN